MVVIYYTGHGDFKGEELRLVTQNCTPKNLLAKGIKPEDLLNGWLESPVRHVWLILDVCHSGKVGEEFTAFQKHLEDDIPADAQNGRGWHVVTSCRGRQSARESVFADELKRAVLKLNSSDFSRHGQLALETLIQDMQPAMAEAEQECQKFGGGDIWPAFFPFEPWLASQSGASANPTDPEAQKENLASLIELLDGITGGNGMKWPPPMFVRLLPASRRLLASRQSFSSTSDLAKWVCGMELDAGRICPLVVLAIRATAESNEIDQEPRWIAEMAKWRGADLKECRKLAEQELEAFQVHAKEHRSRIKVIGKPILSPTGDYSSSVHFRVLHDFEDDDVFMVFPLAQWDELKPTDLALDEYSTKMAGFVSQDCLQDCEEDGEDKDPVVQITLPLHLIHEPVESILIPDGHGKCRLGAE